jgi:hypothetical protein
MNEEMKQAWLEISQMLGEPTREELDVFLRTWQRAIQATRKTLAKPDFWEGYIPEPDKRQQALDKKAENARELGLDYETAQQEPLSDEQIKEIANNSYSPYHSAVVSFARAIEAAHGIKENT